MYLDVLPGALAVVSFISKDAAAAAGALVAAGVGEAIGAGSSVNLPTMTIAAATAARRRRRTILHLNAKHKKHHIIMANDVEAAVRRKQRCLAGAHAERRSAVHQRLESS